jgi:hypothetical protein
VRHLLALTACCCVCVAGFAADDKGSGDTPKAAKTRELLKKKISVDFKDTRLEDALDEIKENVKGLSIRIDAKGGVSRNQTLSYKADNKTVAEVLDGMFQKNGLGYIVISGKNDAYDGSVLIKQGKERGFPLKDK